MINRLKEILGDWLDVLCALIAFPGAALFGLGLCWLLGPGGLGDRGRVGDTVSADHARYELGSEPEPGMVTILRKSETLAVPLHEPGYQAHADYRLALSLSHFGVWTDNLQGGVFVGEQLAERDGYLSVGVSQGHGPSYLRIVWIKTGLHGFFFQHFSPGNPLALCDVRLHKIDRTQRILKNRIGDLAPLIDQPAKCAHGRLQPGNGIAARTWNFSGQMLESEHLFKNKLRIGGPGRSMALRSSIFRNQGGHFFDSPFDQKGLDEFTVLLTEIGGELGAGSSRFRVLGYQLESDIKLFQLGQFRHENQSSEFASGQTRVAFQPHLVNGLFEYAPVGFSWQDHGPKGTLRTISAGYSDARFAFSGATT